MDFRIVKPKQKLSEHIQAIWSVKVAKGEHNAVTKPLYCDGGSGVTFLLQGEARLDGATIKEPFVVQPYSKKTQSLELAEDAWLCGVRFHPGMMPLSLHAGLSDPAFSNEESKPYSSPVADLYTQLKNQNSHGAHLTALYRWCVQHAELNNPILTNRALLLNQTKQGKIGEQFQQHQRQIERNFRKWIGMSPKYFQRLRRVHFSVLALRENPDISLSDLAFHQGFSDQAHMTREFNTFVLATPGEISQKIKAQSKR